MVRHLSVVMTVSFCFFHSIDLRLTIKRAQRSPFFCPFAVNDFRRRITVSPYHEVKSMCGGVTIYIFYRDKEC